MKTLLHHGHIIAECFDFLGKLSLNSSDYLWGVLFFFDWAKSNTFCFRWAAQGQPAKQKHSPKIVLERIVLKNLTNFTGWNLWWSPFLVSCSLCLPKKNSITTLFLWISQSFGEHFFLENSCFKEIVKGTSTETVFRKVLLM